jgi:hypothetical protein
MDLPGRLYATENPVHQTSWILVKSTPKTRLKSTEGTLFPDLSMA